MDGDSRIFSAEFEERVCGGPPTMARIARVRDVIICIASPTSATVEEFQKHPPIDGAAEQRSSPETTGAVDLGHGLRIGRLSSEEERLVMNACNPRGHYFFPIRHGSARHVFISDLGSQPLERLYQWDPSDRLWYALSLSRLIRDNGYSLSYAARIVDYEDGEQMVIYRPDSEGKAVYRFRTTRDWLDAQDGRELRELLAAFFRIQHSLPSRLSRAMWRLEYATSVGWADLALLMLVSGLEALLKTERHAATKQFTERMPALARELDVGGIDSELCERVYGARSEWAHGTHVRMFSTPEPGGEATGPATIDEQQVLSEVALIQDVLRKAVRHAIEDDEFRMVFADEECIRRRWPLLP